MKLTVAKCCGSCIHTNKPKKPRDHAAHYEVSKTERWCFLHECHVVRETCCDDHEGVNRATKTNFTRTNNFNKCADEVKRVAELMGDKRLSIGNVVYRVNNGWIEYGYISTWVDEIPFNYKLKSKQSSTMRDLERIENELK